MTDLRERFDGLNRVAAPDLWTAIESRALEERQDPYLARIVRLRPRRPEWQRRVAAAAVAAVVFFLGTILVWRAFRPSTPPTPVGLPPGWVRCTNDVEGYSIAYPGTWHTTDISFGDRDPSYACRWFSPSPFDAVDERGRPQGNLVSEGYGYPLEVGIGEPFDLAIQHRVAEVRVLTREELVVDGHRAVRLEYETMGDVIAEPGLHYEYFIELDPQRTLFVHTTATRGISGPNGEDYEANKARIDLAVSTLHVDQLV